MEEVNRNAEKRLPERETEVEIRSGNVTKDEPAPRKETTNRSVNPGQVLPLMQVSLRNSRLAFVCESCWLSCIVRPHYPSDVPSAHAISSMRRSRCCH